MEIDKTDTAAAADSTDGLIKRKGKYISIYNKKTKPCILKIVYAF